MNILISGGNFINKGAEAMMFISVNECIRMFNSPHFILQLPNGLSEINTINDMFIFSKRNGKNIEEKAKNKYSKLISLIKAYRNADIMIDVSGLELCSKLGLYPSLRYLFKIALSKWTGTKVFLMPQSYGPFDYGSGIIQKLIHILIQHYMKYPCICFAREKDGVDKLLKPSPKANVVLSSDLVLQNKEIESFLDNDEHINIEITNSSVGFVPNKRMYEQHGRERSLQLFTKTISTARKNGFNVYILCHAIDDIAIADEIKSSFSLDDSVIVIRRVLSCFQYQQIVKHFDFVIASRYHSIVHAYKECVPCVAIGWAIKYKELLSLLQQDNYLLNINDNDEIISNIINDMADKFKIEKKVIEQNLKIIQRNNCFDSIKKYI